MFSLKFFGINKARRTMNAFICIRDSSFEAVLFGAMSENTTIFFGPVSAVDMWSVYSVSGGFG